MFSLDTKEEMPDDAQTIAGITELNNFSSSLVQWALFPVDVHNSVGQGKVIKIEKSSSGEFMVLK